MNATHKRARQMSKHYRSQLVAHLRINIIENPTVDQRMRPIDFDKKCKARSLKVNDDDAEVEYVSYPWYDEKNKEWICVGQFEDEDIPLQLNPFNAMQQFPFYESALMSMTNINPHARNFVVDYMKHLDQLQSTVIDAGDDTKHAQIAKSYVLKLFNTRFKSGINRSHSDWKDSKSNGYKHGVFIPVEIWTEIVLPYLKNNKFNVKTGKVLIDIVLSPMYIANNVCPGGIITKYNDGGQTIIKYQNGITITYNLKNNTLILRQFTYRNRNLEQVLNDNQ